MSRTSTGNYRADTDTIFAWAGDANDFFSRTLDLAYLAIALERHTHAAGRGLPAAGYAPGSIPTAAIVANPIFPGTVSVAAGGIAVTGTSSFTGNVSIAGTLQTTSTIQAGGAISTSAGGLSVAGAITNTAGGASIVGNSTISGTLGVTGAFSCGAITSTGNAFIVGNLHATGDLLASGISTSGGASTVVLSGDTTVNFGFLHVANGPLVVGGNISNTSGGADFFGTTNFHNDSTALANFGVLGNLGVTGVLQPAVSGGSNLGDPALHWATLFADHFTIYGTCSAAGLLSLSAGLTVSAGSTNLAGATINGNIGVTGIGGFTGGVQPGTDNTVTCGNGALRWSAVWAVTGTIQTSSIEAKEHLEPLDPEWALQVTLDTPIMEFQYKTSDAEGNYKDRKTKLPRRLRQVGFVAEDAHPLLMVEEHGVNAQTTASVALAAIQALSAKVEALTAELAELKGTMH